MTPLSTLVLPKRRSSVDGYQPSAGRIARGGVQRSRRELFRPLGIPLVEGREFTRADDEKAALVAMVNENQANRYGKAATPSANACKSRDDGCKWWAWRRTPSIERARNPKPSSSFRCARTIARQCPLVRTPLVRK